MKYKTRVVDEQLDLRLQAFGGVNITGPKGCGKTTTAKHHAKSFVEFQDEDKREGYLAVVNSQPSRLLEGTKPRLFDEWQDAPKIWGAIRKAIDDSGEKGQFILTGSSANVVETPHTGTLRISTLPMKPMSLHESGESNGEVSLAGLFNDPNSFDGCHSDLSVDELIFAICRGGWPAALSNTAPKAQLEIAKDLFYQTAHVDISNVDKKKRNPAWTEAILRSYARNISTAATTKTILADVRANHEMSDSAYYEYLAALEKLFIIEDVEAWSPSIRSKTAIRASKKRNFVDPSIAVAALGIGPEYFNTDFKTLGFLFESLCMRDLSIYAGGRSSLAYYHDKYGLEADAVVSLEDGRYALVEVKLGSNDIDEGAKHLMKIEGLIVEHNKKEARASLRLPDLKIVLTGTEYGFKREDGVLVIPLGCLKE